MSEAQFTTFPQITTNVVAAYITKSDIPMSEVPSLIATIHTSFAALGKAPAAAPEPKKLIPPVSIKKSVTDEYIVSMEDGKRYQSLKRHLTKHGLTPTEYRTKWGLPFDYSMIAAAYARKRSEVAKRKRVSGLRRDA